MNENILVLEIVNTHGLRGDVRALYFADGPDFFDSLEFVQNEAGEKLYFEKVRVQKGALLIKFRGIDTPEAAENLRGTKWYVRHEELQKLPEGEFYIADLIGLTVMENAREIGKVSDIIAGGSGQIMEIRLPSGKKALIPFVDAFVKNVNLSEKTVSVELIEGMLDEI